MTLTLDICGDKEIQNPTDTDIRQAVSSLDTDKNSAFLVLATSELTYMQTSGDKNIGFSLEYQEGNTEHHYQAKRDDFTAEEIIQAMISYCAGSENWKKISEWMRIDV